MGGKELERLVQFIEGQLLPEGLTVTANDRVFNDDGVQIAEFDIRITGPVGSTEIDWLIECRDRPSDGAAPREWIQQLLGRRDDFGFTNVSAVSTTGFSPGATELAEARGIDIRSVDEVTPEAFRDWFLVQKLHFIQSKGDLKHAEIILDTDSPVAAKEEASLLVSAVDSTTPLLTHTETGNPLTMHDAWTDFINRNPQIFKGLEANGPHRAVTIHANYTNPASRYKIVSDKGEAHVIRIIFDADLSVKHTELPVAKATEYKKVEGDQIAQTVTFDLTHEDRRVELAIHRIGPEGKTIVAVRKSSGA